VKVLGMTGMKGRVEGEGVGALWYLSGYVFNVDFRVGIVSY